MAHRKQKYIVNQTDKEALKIHGYISENPSDSDSGKSEFDEEYYKNKPPPIAIDPSQIICVKNLPNTSHKQRQLNNINSYRGEMNYKGKRIRHRSEQKPRQQHHINSSRGEINNNKMLSKANENEYANKQTGSFMPSKTYFNSSTTAVDPPALNADQRFGTNKSTTKANYIQPNDALLTIPDNSASRQAKRSSFTSGSSKIFFTEEMRYQLERTNAFISEYNKQANINSDLKENKYNIKPIPEVYAEYSSLSIRRKPSSNSSDTYIDKNITTKKAVSRTSVNTNSIQPSPEMYSTPNTSTTVLTIPGHNASTTNNLGYLSTKRSQATIKTAGSSKVIAKSVSGYKNRQANEYENGTFDNVPTVTANLVKEQNVPGGYCSQVCTEEDDRIVDNYVVADETHLFNESEDENHCNNCCIIL